MSVVLNACQFNQSFNKDLTTGAYSRGDGIGCSDVTIEINGKAESRNNFIYGEKVKFVFSQVSGLKSEEGKVYPGLSLHILENEKDTAVSYSDLLDYLKDGIDVSASPLQLSASFVSVLPFENNQKYKAFVKIWDKKGDGAFTYELPFIIEENKVLKINSGDLNYSSIYLWDDTKKHVLADNNVPGEDTLLLIMKGLDGMKITDGKVYPGFSIEITNGKGNKVLSNPNIFMEYEKIGVDTNVFRSEPLVITITFPPGKITNPYKVEASLIDLSSDKKIDVTADLILE